MSRRIYPESTSSVDEEAGIELYAPILANDLKTESIADFAQFTSTTEGFLATPEKELETIVESSKHSHGKERLRKNQLKPLHEDHAVVDGAEGKTETAAITTDSSNTLPTSTNPSSGKDEESGSDRSSRKRHRHHHHSDKKHPSNPEHQHSNAHIAINPVATTWDLYFLGLNIVMCGTLFSWNTGFYAGFWEYFFAVITTAIAYIFLITCLAEMSTALPFHGGMYGFIRLTVGPYMGFFVGCCEIVQNILCVATTVQPVGFMITEMTGWHEKYEPIYWIIFYISALLICTAKDKIFWRFNAFIAILSILLIVIFLLGSLPYVDYSKYAYRGHRFTPSGVYVFDGVAMLENLPTASWLFMGVELVPLAAGAAIHPKKSLVKAMLGGIATFIVLGILIFFCVGTQAPGAYGYAEYFVPMNYRYSQMFNMPETLCNIFAIPGCYATAFGFLYAAGRQMGSMGQSGLFPDYMGKVLADNHTPHIALITAALVSLFVNCVSLSTLVEENFLLDLFLVTLLGSYFVYIWTFIGYIIYVNKYRNLRKDYASPFGKIGAYLGLLFFVLTSISTIALQGGNYRVIVIFAGYMIVMSLYYYQCSLKRQFFSEDEKHALFQAYVIKANIAKRGKGFSNYIPAYLQYTSNTSVHHSHSYSHSHPASHSHSQSQSSIRSSVRNASVRSAANYRVVASYANPSIGENCIPEGQNESNNRDSNLSGNSASVNESNNRSSVVVAE